MGGIAGLYARGKLHAEVEQVLQRMAASISHRGTHSRSVVDAHVGLCALSHRLPAPHAHAATAYHAAQAALLVADARIDNRDELLRVFGWHPQSDTEIPDGAFILEAYARWGTGCPEHLRGAFAFALWDAARRTLFCARDHLGLRPFYYVLSDHLFAFGSEIKALFAAQAAPRQIREVAIADFLMRAPHDAEGTFYENVLRLRPAHTLTVTQGASRLRCYWQMDPQRELQLKSNAAYADAFRERFEEAVRCRIRTDRTLGCLLSGGLDSSAITAVARAQLAEERPTEGGERPLDTFSLIFEEARASDERDYIEAVVRQGGLRSHYVCGDSVGLFEALDDALHHIDQPFLAPNLHLHWLLYRTAQQQGIEVLLDGLFGDNVVGHGDAYLTELALRGRWVSLVREVRRAATRWRGGWRVARYVIRRYLWSPLVAEPLREASRNLAWLFRQDTLARALLGPGFARRIAWNKRARQLADHRLATGRSLRRGHYAELSSGLIPGALEVASHASANFDLEPRYPFLDHRLVAFCLALPASQRFCNGQTRVVLRRALRSYYPDTIYRRNTKANLSYAFAHALRTRSSTLLRDIVEDRASVATPYLNRPWLRRTYQQFQEGASSERVCVALWQTVVLVRWLEREQEAARRVQSPSGTTRTVPAGHDGPRRSSTERPGDEFTTYHLST